MKQTLLLAAAAGLMLWPQPTVRAQSSAEKGDLKVQICHLPPGNPENWQTIWVSPWAVPAHQLLHGDTLGACGEISAST